MAKKWQKGGPSPNPAGCPKGPKLAPSLTRELKQIADEIDPHTGKTNARMWAEAQNRRMTRGEPKALELGYERLDGKVPQQVNLDANMHVDRVRRLTTIEKLLTTLPVEDGPRDDRAN